MGREIRRVPANYVHPQYHNQYRGREDVSMDSRSLAEAQAEWDAEKVLWEAGTHEMQKYYDADTSYDEYASERPEQPKRGSGFVYRTWEKVDAVWWQVWQTVSEGSPVSPPFATAEELIDYLAEHGDTWDQESCRNRERCRLYGLRYGESGWGRERAERFVKSGWAPSMIAQNGQITEGKLAV